MIFSEVFKKLFVSCQVRNSFDLDHDKMIPHNPDRSKTDIKVNKKRSGVNPI